MTTPIRPEIRFKQNDGFGNNGIRTAYPPIVIAPVETLNISDTKSKGKLKKLDIRG